MRIAIAVMAGALLAGTAAAQPQPWRLTPEGYGPARIGMTRAQVSSALGITLEGEAIEDADACVEMAAASGFPGIYFMFVDRRLSRISVSDRSRVTTPRGIGVGASVAQVRRAYPRGLRDEPHEYVGPQGRYLTYWVRPGVRGVRFETDQRRRVRTIHAGDQTIQYVEGCA